MFQLYCYLLNVLFALGLVDIMQHLAKVELVKNVFDLLLMLFLVALSRIFSLKFERIYKKVLNKFKNKRK